MSTSAAFLSKLLGLFQSTTRKHARNALQRRALRFQSLEPRALLSASNVADWSIGSPDMQAQPNGYDFLVTLAPVLADSLPTVEADGREIVDVTAAEKLLPQAGDLIPGGPQGVTPLPSTAQFKIAESGGAVGAVIVRAFGLSQTQALAALRVDPSVVGVASYPLAPDVNVDGSSTEPYPSVTAISVHSGSTTGGTTVTITGTNLANATAVDFGGGYGLVGGAAFSGTIVSDTDTQIVVKSPAESYGTVDVTVIGEFGPSIATAADKYTYTSGATLTINGSGYHPFIFDASASDGTIVVTANGAQTTYAAGQFSYYVYNANGSSGTIKAIGGAGGNTANFYAPVPFGYATITDVGKADSLQNQAAGYTLRVSGGNKTFFYGQAGDTANFLDSYSGNDTFYAWAAHPNFDGQPLAEMSGIGYGDFAVGFGANTAQASAGSHTAYFFTTAYSYAGLSPNDTYLSSASHPNFNLPAAEMYGAYGSGKYDNLAIGFVVSQAFSARGVGSADFFPTTGATLTVGGSSAEVSWSGGFNYAAMFGAVTDADQGVGDTLRRGPVDYYFYRLGTG